MSIAPDTKDWTWILARRCPECGYEAASVEPSSVADRMRSITAVWCEALASGPPDQLATRVVPDRWSTLEYGCHVRDVCRRMDGRLALMLAEDDPTFPNWDQDATAVEDAYDRQDPRTVAGELRLASASAADRFAGVRADQWGRTGRRSDGALFTVASLGIYFVHDPYHHLVDIGLTPPG